jgi:hypothetical protein
LTGGLAERLAAALERLEALLPAPPEPTGSITGRFAGAESVSAAICSRCGIPTGCGWPTCNGLTARKTALDLNMRQFLAGRPCNNVLLWGARGTGKSSLIKALLNEYADRGLRLIEVDKHDLLDLPEIVDPLYDRPERFLLYCDDLSFEADDPSYKALKAMLDGSISAAPDNVLLCATSNRRHLLPEYMRENQDARISRANCTTAKRWKRKSRCRNGSGCGCRFTRLARTTIWPSSHWLEQLGWSGGLE